MHSLAQNLRQASNMSLLSGGAEVLESTVVASYWDKLKRGLKLSLDFELATSTYVICT